MIEVSFLDTHHLHPFLTPSAAVIDHLIVKEKKDETKFAMLCRNWPCRNVVGLTFRVKSRCVSPRRI